MVIGDLLDQEKLDRCMKNVQYLYHLAGIADIGEATAEPVETVKTSVLGTTCEFILFRYRDALHCVSGRRKKFRFFIHNF